MAATIARIGKPHGLRGEVTVQLHTDEPERRLAIGARLDTQAAPGSGVPRSLTVLSTRVHRGIWLVGFEEIPDRTGAESLRGTFLRAPQDAVDQDPAPDDAEGYFEEELVGLSVVSPGGELLGKVSGLQLGAAQDLLKIALPDGRQALVPFVEALVPVVDLQGGRVVLDAPPGLLDLAQ